MSTPGSPHEYVAQGLVRLLSLPIHPADSLRAWCDEADRFQQEVQVQFPGFALPIYVINFLRDAETRCRDQGYAESQVDSITAYIAELRSPSISPALAPDSAATVRRGDLSHPLALKAKGALFLFLGLLSATLLVMENHEWRHFFLLALAIWAFCRFYYFAFYVIEHYVDRRYRFAGLWHFARYMARNRAIPERNRTQS